MQPAGSVTEGVKLRKGEVPDVQVNQPAFWKKKENQIPVDQLFFYNYFKRKDEMECKIKRKKSKGDEDENEDEDEGEEGEEDEEKEAGESEDENEKDEDDEEEDSELEEAEIWKVRISCHQLIPPTLMAPNRL